MPPNFGDTNLKGVRHLICCLTVAGTFFLPVLPISAQRSEECEFLVSPQDFNTFEGDGERIVIGQFEDRPYVVILTRDLQENLNVIRACIPDAFLTSSRLGRYVQVASFDNYREARELAEHIDQSLGVDVRVIHYNRMGK